MPVRSRNWRHDTMNAFVPNRNHLDQPSQLSLSWVGRLSNFSSDAHTLVFLGHPEVNDLYCKQISWRLDFRGLKTQRTPMTLQLHKHDSYPSFLNLQNYSYLPFPPESSKYNKGSLSFLIAYLLSGTQISLPALNNSQFKPP